MDLRYEMKRRKGGWNAKSIRRKLNKDVYWKSIELNI